MKGLMFIVAASVAVLSAASALPQPQAEVDTFPTKAAACAACIASSGLAGHACDCCDNWSTTPNCKR
ncbi:hypothetical protein ACN47E_007299 [Coniothyrium glycines]